jgi:hypothetical protein
MSYESLEGQRKDVADTILTKVGEALGQAELTASAKTADPAMKKLMAARIALEYAVLATARERRVATELAAAALSGATTEQQAAMLKEGAAALGRAYRVEPDVLANVFAGQMASVEMPNGAGSTLEIDKMVDTCRNLMTGIIMDEYARRAGSDGMAEKGDSFLALKAEGVVAPAKSELAARLAFMESSIDAAAGQGAISWAHADLLKARIETQVFQPRSPQSGQFSKAFTEFFEDRGKGLRIEAMKEVRGVSQSQTDQEIGAKLRALMPTPGGLDSPPDHRAYQPRER